jgi:hypothetical protein
LTARFPRFQHYLDKNSLVNGIATSLYYVDERSQTVTVKAVGWKEHNKLFIRGKEYQL